jgi:hypothetical protein
MKKVFPAILSFVVLILLFSSTFSITSCTKTNTIIEHDTTIVRDTTTITDTLAVCNVQGTYAGTATASPGASTAGTSNSESYTLAADNLAIGYAGSSETPVTFGGYTNTCDSVIISAYYLSNNDYYILKGALTSNQTVLSGTYQNLTNTTDFGTFSFTKQ